MLQIRVEIKKRLEREKKKKCENVANMKNAIINSLAKNKIPWYRRPISDGNPVEAVTREHVLHAKSADQITERSISNSLTKSRLCRESISASNREKRSFSRRNWFDLSTLKTYIYIYILYNITACIYKSILSAWKWDRNSTVSPSSPISEDIYIYIKGVKDISWFEYREIEFRFHFSDFDMRRSII